jgi:NitT/TauT family transport system ATP-binding protein
MDKLLRKSIAYQGAPGKFMEWKELKVRNIAKRFGNSKGREVPPILKDINLTIEKGSFYCVLGPSGCGKTTLLNIIAGFERPDSGTISYDDKQIVDSGSDRVMIFQDIGNSLFPWLTAIENVEFGLKEKKIYSKKSRYELAVKYLDMVGLSRDIDKFPFELSGGMKQRVQMARALVLDPEVLLMDEPFGALDAITKRLLQYELFKIWRETKKTIIFITHDIIEALIMGSHIAIMCSGPGATIIEYFPIEINEPRKTSNPDFIKIYEKIEKVIEKEVVKTRE